MAAGAIGVGAEAPDFELKDQHGQPVRLSTFRGQRPVLVVFYPWAFSGICGGELHELQASLDEIEGQGVAVLAISADAMFSLRAWADRDGFTFPLLSDFWPHGGVAQAYGVFEEKVGVALRGTFLVDTEGVVRWSVLKGIGDARSLAEYKGVLAELQP